MRIADEYSFGKNDFPKDKEGICVIDGAVEGNPGEGGIGIVLKKKVEGEPLIALSKRVGKVTSNEAEWLAFLEALRLAKREGFSKLVVITDSQLLLKQWNGSYKVRAPHLQKLHKKARDLAMTFEELKVLKLSRRWTREAHRLANKAMEGGKEK